MVVKHLRMNCEGVTVLHLQRAKRADEYQEYAECKKLKKDECQWEQNAAETRRREGQEVSMWMIR